MLYTKQLADNSQAQPLAGERKYMENNEIKESDEQLPVGSEAVGYLTMPRELTAENGAKKLLIGEFHEVIYVDNPDYCGCGEHACDICQEANEPETIPQKVMISWSTIKDIYKMAVEHLGR